MRKKLSRRLLAAALSTVMVLSMLPAGFASEVDSGSGDTTPSTESTEPTTPDAGTGTEGTGTTDTGTGETGTGTTDPSTSEGGDTTTGTGDTTGGTSTEPSTEGGGTTTDPSTEPSTEGGGTTTDPSTEPSTEGGETGGETGTTPAAGSGVTHTLDFTKLPNGTNDTGTAVDKVIITNADLATAGDTGGYFSVWTDGTNISSTVEVSPTVKSSVFVQRRNGTNNAKAAEIAKQMKGGIAFSVMGTAKLSANMASTNGTNGSMMALVKVAEDGSVSIVAPKSVSGGASGGTYSSVAAADDTTKYGQTNSSTADGDMYTAEAGVVVVYGNNTPGTTAVWEGLEAGDYRLTTYSDYDKREGWIISMSVEESGGVTSNTYTFDATTDVATGKDSVAIDTGVYGTSGFFTVSGTVNRRTKDKAENGPVTSVELGSSGSGYAQFELNGNGEAVITVASTGTTNTSMFALVKVDGETLTVVAPESISGGKDDKSAIANGSTVYSEASKADVTPVQGVAIVYGSSPSTVLTYSNLEAGTYQMMTYKNCNWRATRLLKAEVTDTVGGKIVNQQATWNTNTIVGSSATVTATTNASNPSVVDITVTGPKVGKTKEVTEENGETVITNTSYADSVLIQVFKESEVVKEFTVTTTGTQKASWTPSASGTYTVKAFAVREGENNLAVGTDATVKFTLPLETPVISAATSKGTGSDGKGTVELIWGAVPEAEKYTIAVKQGSTDFKSEETTNTTFTVGALELDTKYTFTVTAVRGNDTKVSAAETVTTTADAQTTWVEVAYGITNGTAGNYVVGDMNGSETVQIVATNSSPNAGKIQGTGSDGLTFYYTKIPTSQNFTLRGTIDIPANGWQYTNGQEGFGLLVTDMVPAKSCMGTEFYTNQYMLAVTKGKFYYNFQTGSYAPDQKSVVGPTNQRVSWEGRLGVYAMKKTGWDASIVGADGFTKPTDFNTATDNGATYPLDITPSEWKDPTGKTSDPLGADYNVVGNAKNQDSLNTAQSDYFNSENILTIGAKTSFDFEIKRNNSGYTLTYYNGGTKGATTMSKTFYYPTDEAGYADRSQDTSLQTLDKDYVYVGFFAARSFTINIDPAKVQLTTIAPEDDAAAEIPPAVLIPPTVEITSPGDANQTDYPMTIIANVLGTAQAYVNGVKQGEPVAITETGVNVDIPNVKLGAGQNEVSVSFTPDPDEKQGFNSYTHLATTSAVTAAKYVTWNTERAYRNNLYISPTGKSTGNGSPTNPLDIYTAVKMVQPGQTIVVMEGEYLLVEPVKIVSSMSGTAEKAIRMIADPGTVEDTAGDDTAQEPAGDEAVGEGAAGDGTATTADAEPAEGETTEGETTEPETTAKTRPVFNFQGKCQGFVHDADYWYFQGFDVTGASNGEDGFLLSGNNNTIDRCNFYHNGNTGLQIARASGSNAHKAQWPANNLVLNCTAYGNADAGYEDADGFAAKLTVGDGNVFDGCISYNNADDGWDLFAKTATGSIGVVTIRNCITYSNGYLEDGTNAGNGNGFKMGGDGMPGAHVLENSFSFFNKMKGIDSNSCPDIKINNSTSYNNGGGNVSLYTTENNKTTDFAAQGIVSFKDSTLKTTFDGFGSGVYAAAQTSNKGTAPESAYDELAAKAQTDTTAYNNATTYYYLSGKSANTSGTQVTTDSFTSLDWKGWTRDENGKITLTGDFLTLASLTDAGADISKFPSSPAVEPIVPDAAESDDTPSTGKTPVHTNPNLTGGGDTSTPVTPVEPEPEPNVVETTTNAETGETTVTVTSPDGEVLATVTIPAELPVDEEGFTDVPADHWAAEAINTMAGLGLVKGVDEEARVYDKDASITRGALATVLYRFSNGKEGYAVNFSDVAAGTWYTDAVAWADKAGVVTGYTDGTFGPDNAITRQELAVMLCRYARLIGKDTATTNSLSAFVDGAGVGSWAAPSLGWCVDNGILNGRGDGVLDPTTTATRAECAVMLSRFINLIK